MGDINSMLDLGIIHHNDKNYQAAIDTWSLGAIKDDSRCYYNIGCIYDNLKNTDETIKHWEKSAELNHKPAIEGLISIYEKNNNF